MSEPNQARTPSQPVEPVAGPLWWDRTLFSRGDARDETCPPVIDITGRTRVLVFGPRLPLSSGRWRFTAKFELCKDAGSYPYVIQFDDGVRRAEEQFGPLGAGRYEISIENGWPEVRVAVMRLWVMWHAFHGELRFEGASVERIGDCTGASEPTTDQD